MIIRALLGGFMLACIEAAKQQRYEAEIARVDPNDLTDRELSDWIHGRQVDFDAVERRKAARVRA